MLAIDEIEQPLLGGNVTNGVVRVGNTVRRPAGAWTPAVHALLEHLTAVGFSGSPRSFGVDEDGRHVVEWIEGQTTNPYELLSAHSPSPHNIGKLIREFEFCAWRWAQCVHRLGSCWAWLCVVGSGAKRARLRGHRYGLAA